MTHCFCRGFQKNVGQRPAGFWKALEANADGLSHCVYLTPQLIRGGFDSIINLIFRLFFSKRRPAITLEDPNIKYALRLIDKQVTASAHDSHMSCAPDSSSCVH